jgi:hypothetical protein
VAEEIAKGLSVSPVCQGLLGEIPGYVWQTDRGSGLTRDVPVKVNDDACDALRYGIMGMRGGSWRGASDVAVV